MIEFSYSLVTTSEIDQKVAGLKAGVKAGGRKNRQVKNSIRVKGWLRAGHWLGVDWPAVKDFSHIHQLVASQRLGAKEL